jgi:YD repeat-containing protein
MGDSAVNLTDEHGIVYLFKDVEYTRVSPSRGRIHHISAWYLTRMVSADKADTISFVYARASAPTLNTTLNQQISIVSSAVKVLDGGDGQFRFPQDTYKDDNYSYTSVATKRLSRIYFKGGYVDFQSLANRLDGVGDERLQALAVIAHHEQDTLKRINFYHSYFNQDNSPLTNAASLWRLRLDSFAIASPSAHLVLPPYRFAYNPTALPDKIVGSRDFWGYPNGARTSYSPTGKPWLIPATMVESIAYKGLTQVGGADRKVNPRYQQAGMLTDIRYPTGGWHHFTYEPNTIAERYEVPNPRTSIIANATTPPGGFVGGGQRVTDERTFSITYPVVKVRAAINISASSDANDGLHSRGTITLSDITTASSTVVASWFGTAADPNNSKLTLELPDGTPYLKNGHTYKITVVATGAASADIDLSYEAATITYATRNSIMGGVRIREQRIQPAAKGPATLKRYYYNRPNSSESSGYLINAIAPVFTRKTISRIEGPGDPNCTPGGAVVCAQKSIIDITFTTVSTNSLGELEGTEQAVGYSTVTVVDSATTGQVGGRTVSTYTKQQENGTNRKPYPPKVIASWKRGNLLLQKQYKQSVTGELELVRKLVNEYETIDSVRIQGLTVTPSASFSGGTLFTLEGELSPYYTLEGPPPPTDPVWPFAYLNTVQLSGWQRIARVRQYQYAGGDTSTYHLTTTTYRYANARHQQPTFVETIYANGQCQQVRSRYVADYDVAQVSSSSPPSAQALRELEHGHALAQLVEQTTTRTTPIDTVVIQSNITLSQVLAPGVVVAARQLSLRTPTPLAWLSFKPAQLLAGRLKTDTRYEDRVIFDSYDVQRQLAQAHVPGGLPTSYLWDMHTGQPLAKVANAAVKQVAVTSFEPNASGQWEYDTKQGIGQHLVKHSGHTGIWAYQLDSNWPISRDAIPAGEYEVACWYKGSQAPVLLGTAGIPIGIFYPTGPTIGGWQAVRARLRLSTIGYVQVSASNSSAAILVDDLSLMPVGSQLTSLTYDGLRGMTSQTDPTGRITFYEYDGLGRLVRTRDEQGRILSQQQYHYAGAK